MTYFAAFLISSFYIGLKAMQQLNVVHMRYLAVWPISLCLAAAEVHLIVLMAKSGGGLIFVPIGLGAATGCTISMKLHQKRFRAGNVRPQQYNRSLTPPTKEALDYGFVRQSESEGPSRFDPSAH